MSKTLKRILTASLAALMVAGVGASATTTNNANARRHYRHYRYHRVSRWYRGVPYFLRGRYHAYRGQHIYMSVQRTYAYIQDEYNDPITLHRVSTHRLGGNRYRIGGRNDYGSYVSFTLTKRHYGVTMNYGHNAFGRQTLNGYFHRY